MYKAIRDNRTFQGGLNQDDDLHVVPNGDYRYALNIRVSQQGSVGVVTNERGTVEKSFSLPSGTNKVIGAVKDPNNNSIIYFLYNDTLANQSIVEYKYSNNTFYTLYNGAILNFSNTPSRVIQARVVSNYLIWTDGENPLRKLDLNYARTQEGDRKYRVYFGKWEVLDFTNNTYNRTAFINGTSYAISSNPDSPSVIHTFNVSTDYTSLSAAIQAFVDDFNNNVTSYSAEAFENYAVITQELTTTDIVLGEITVGGTVPTGRFPKCWVVPDNYIHDYSNEINIEYVKRYPIKEPVWSTDFFNPQGLSSEVQQLVPVNERSLQFAWNFNFKDKSRSVLSSLSKLKPSTILDGQNYETSTHIIINCIDDLIATTNYDFLRDLLFVDIFYRENITGNYKLWKTVSQGDLYPNSSDNSDIGFYFTGDSNGSSISTLLETKSFESLPVKVKAIESIITQNGVVNALGGLTENYDYKPLSAYARVGFHNYLHDSVNSNNFQNVPSLKRGSRYKLGVIWKDQFGRNIGVSTCDALDVYIPRVTELTSVARPSVIGTPATREREGAYVRVDINNTPSNIPVYAHSYQLAITHNLTFGFFRQFVAYRVILWDTETDAEVTTIPSVFEKKHEIRISISNLEEYFGDAYAFADGDRIRLIKTRFASQQYLYADETFTGVTRSPDFKIKGVTGNYLTIDALENDANGLFDDAIFDNRADAENRVLIEIYRPSVASENVFYEFGSVVKINNPGKNNRSLSSASVSTLNAFGDVYPMRLEYYVKSPDDSNRFSEVENFEVFNRDIKNQTWNRDIGRISTYLPNTQQTDNKTTIQLTGQLSADNSINQMFEISPSDRQILPNQFGWIRSLITNGDVMLALHENSKTVSMYLGKVQSVDASGNNQINYSDQIIGSRNVLNGEYGTQHPASVIEKNGSIYWVDVRQQCVVRYSGNALNAISNIKMTNFFDSQLKNLSNESLIIGGFDEEHNEYIVSGPWSATLGAISFNVNRNRWSSFYNYSPEMMVSIDNRMFSFKDGVLHQHNDDEAPYSNYYGTRMDYEIDIVFNEAALQPKIARTLTIGDTNLWLCPTITTPEGQETEVALGHIDEHEHVHSAWIPYDKNTPNMLTNEAWVNGNHMRSTVFVAKFRGSLEVKVSLRHVILDSIISNLI